VPRSPEARLRPPWRPARALLTGTLIVAALDALDALLFFGLRGVPPARIFQAIAAGLLGRPAAFRGGAATLCFGLLLHCVVAFGIVSVYFAASRRLRVLTRRPVVCGMLYGVAAFFVMQFVVVPLSALGQTSSSPAVLVNGVLGHALLVGLPAALCARAARPAL